MNAVVGGPDFFTIDTQEDRLIRNFMWHERKHIFENHNFVGSLLIAMCLRDTAYGAMRPEQIVEAPRILEELTQNQYYIHSSQLRAVTVPLYQNFLKCLDFILNEVRLEDHLQCRTDVSKMQFGYLFNAHAHNVEQGYLRNFNETKDRVIEHIRRKAEIRQENHRNSYAAAFILPIVSEDVYKNNIHSHTLSHDLELPTMTVEEALAQYRDPNIIEVYHVLDRMLFG